jgi:protein-L-isoaspartate(D-aspartate) O-methyltransferase
MSSFSGLKGYRIKKGVLGITKDIEVILGAEPNREASFQARRAAGSYAGPVENTYDRYLKLMHDEADFCRKVDHVARDNNAPWELTRQGKIKWLVDPHTETATSTARAAMVRDQLRSRGIRAERVLVAMATVPRERFVGSSDRHAAYADEALPIDAGQTISQPYMVAVMTELLATRPGDRILEIGTGSGYQAAILATLGCRVTTIERHDMLASAARDRLEALGFAATVEVRVGDGSLGVPDRAPWDGIIVTAGAPRVPHALREQLADGARLVVPVGPRERQVLTVVARHGNDWIERPEGACVFVPLVGEDGYLA